MELITKPDYSYLAPSADTGRARIYFLGRSLGLPPKTEREDGYPERPDAASLEKICAYFPVSPRQMIFMDQVHLDVIVHKENKKPSFPTADGLITAVPGIALCIKTADCVPIFFYDPVKHAAAAVHAGWRGTGLRITKKAIQKMEHFFKSDTSDIRAFIGPAIGSCCYEVGKEVYDSFGFLGRHRNDYFGRLKSGKYMMDIKGINAFGIEQEGVPAENIEVSELCTKCRADLFHSYRRDGAEAGRNVSFILLQ